MFLEFFLHVHYTYAYVRIHAHYFLVHVIVLNLLTLLLIDGSNPAPGGTMQYLFFFQIVGFYCFQQFLLILYVFFFLRLWRCFTVDTVCCRSGRVPIQPTAMVPAGPLHSQDFHAVGRDVGVYNSTVNVCVLCLLHMWFVYCLVVEKLSTIDIETWNQTKKIQQDLLVGSTKRTSFLGLLGWSYIAYWPYKVVWPQARVTGLTRSWYLLVWLIQTWHMFLPSFWSAQCLRSTMASRCQGKDMTCQGA